MVPLPKTLADAVASPVKAKSPVPKPVTSSENVIVASNDPVCTPVGKSEISTLGALLSMCIVIVFDCTLPLPALSNAPLFFMKMVYEPSPTTLYHSNV